MPRIAYVKKRFNETNLNMVAIAHGIMEEYREQGFVLTVRQLYYQFVGRGAFPEDRRWRWDGSRYVKDPDGTKNAQPNYKWLSGLINDARMGGYLDWDLIEDRTRSLEGRFQYDDPRHALDIARRAYCIDMWENQDIRPEVWVEKEALQGVVERVCRKNDVDYFCCKGYVSQSAAWEAGRRMKQRYEADGQETLIIHLGDHDPSGIDMTRDNKDRVSTFSEKWVDINRVALNMDQVEQYDPPSDPAKLTDSRAKEYIKIHGDESWELDALEPSVMEDLILEAVDGIRDMDSWSEREDQLEQDLEQLDKFIEECDL